MAITGPIPCRVVLRCHPDDRDRVEDAAEIRQSTLVNAFRDAMYGVRTGQAPAVEVEVSLTIDVETDDNLRPGCVFVGVPAAVR